MEKRRPAEVVDADGVQTASLRRVTERALRHATERREAHRADVAYVQERHPELAKWLTEMVQEFGRDVEYRGVLR